MVKTFLEEQMGLTEELYITKTTYIKEGETVEYTDRIIHVESIIDCYGTMNLEHCVIIYNDDKKGTINIAGGAGMYAKNCVFICKNANKYYFIQVGEKASDACIQFEECEFFDCSHFITALSGGLERLIIKSSTLYNCAACFVDVSVKDCVRISNVKILQSDLKEFNVPAVCEYFSTGDDVMFSIFCDDTEVDNIYIEESEDYRGKVINAIKHKNNYIDDEDMEKILPYFSLWKNGIIKNSTFINVRDIGNFYEIDGCEFERCSRVTLAGGYDPFHDILIHDCVFLECNSDKYLIDFNMEYCVMKIENSRFIGCNGGIIKGSYKTLIYACEFNSCKAAGNPLILLEWRESKVDQCSFDCIDADDDFIIAANYNLYRKEIMLVVSDCSFYNCSTRNKTKKLIREIAVDKGRFNRVKEFKTVKIEKTIGWDTSSFVSSLADIS